MTPPTQRQIELTAIELPESVCFRVTRNCNARCRFCLAPPEGEQPDGLVLKHRIDWLLAHGVKTIHFCGGEPTLHPSLAALLKHVHESAGNCRLTTNGIAIGDELISLLRATATKVKVSLHGDQAHHNAMMGVTSFKHTTKNIRRLMAAGVNTSVQATVIAGQSGVIDWLAEFCVELGVRRLSILPFIPRGRGGDCDAEFALSSQERRDLRQLIKKKRHRFNGRVDIRRLDFNSQLLYVVEADGRVVIEAATEAMDRVLGHIPHADVVPVSA